jgi:hypothetical protein
MVEVIFINNAFVLQGREFKLISYNKVSEMYVDAYSVADGWDEWNTSFGANETIINGVLQTSADMIMQTLSGQ